MIGLDDGTGSRGNTGPQVGAFLGNGTRDGRTLHFTLGLSSSSYLESVFMAASIGYIENSR